MRLFLYTKEGDRQECTNYREISLLDLQGKVYAKCLEKKCRKTVKSKLEDWPVWFCPGRSTMDQLFTLRQISEKSWERAKDVFACFVDLEKAYDQVPRDKLWIVLQEYGIAIEVISCGCWCSARVYFVTSRFHNLLELDRQAQPNQ